MLNAPISLFEIPRWIGGSIVFIHLRGEFGFAGRTPQQRSNPSIALINSQPAA
jgi:hypothetical protein